MAAAAQKNTKGSAVPTGVGQGNTTEKSADRNREAGGGKEPLKEPLGSSGANQEDSEKNQKKEESGPCGLPKSCNIL